MNDHLKERIKSYMKSRGMEALENFSSGFDEKSDMTFNDGMNLIFMKVFHASAFQNRNAFLDSILRSLSFTKKANKVYIAIPKVYASIIDGKIFQEYGLGLMLYDERTIEEVFQPKVFEIQKPEASNPIVPKEFFEELERLKDRVSSLEQSVYSLKEELSRIKLDNKLKEVIPNTKPCKVEERIQVDEDLPSFLKDNPWLEILSKRGREQQSYVS
ncbi:MAG: hypothetical protein QXG01_07040 [Candidatus Bathyarchaeia archaeon]